MLLANLKALWLEIWPLLHIHMYPGTVSLAMLLNQHEKPSYQSLRGWFWTRLSRKDPGQGKVVLGLPMSFSVQSSIYDR